MKKTFLLSVLFLFAFINKSSAQTNGNQVEVSYSYYDSLTHKKVKEIFHHKQVMKIMPDKKHYGEYIDTTFFMKSGPYFFYFENGNVQCTGFYENEKKDSIWKYYDDKGKLLKTEKYYQGLIVK